VTIRIVAANEASFEDLQAIFGTRGEAWLFQCQRYKLGPGEAFRNFPVQERAQRLRGDRERVRRRRPERGRPPRQAARGHADRLLT
jgi:hypothetical protein